MSQGPQVEDVGQRLAPGSPMRPVLVNLWRLRRLVAGVTLVSAVLGFALSQLQPERYEATAEMLLTDPRNATLFSDVATTQTNPFRYVRNQAQRVMSTAVAARAVSLLDDTLSVADVRERIQATPSDDFDLITVTASGPTAEEAAALTNAAVQAYEDVVAAEMRASAEEALAQLRESLGQIQARVNEAGQALRESPGDEVAQLQLDADVTEMLATQQLIERLSIDTSLYGSGVEMVEPAPEPDAPVAPRTLRNTILAALLGFGAVGGVVVWRGDALRRVDRRHEPQEVLNVPLLGSIPELTDLKAAAVYPTISDPESPAAEAFRFAAAAIEAKLGRDVRSIVVTSTGAGDGKTTVALNLAVALHQDTRPVLVIDSDIRKHGLSRLTGTEGMRGLTDAVEDDNALKASIHSWPPGAGAARVAISPVGRHPVEPAVFFRTVRYRSLLNQLRQHGYLSVIDAPPLLAVSDASAISGSADAIVLVVNRGTPVRILDELKERLAFVGTPVLGYVFNRSSDRGQGYGYGYGYGQPTRESGDAAATTGAGDTRTVAPRVYPDVPPPSGNGHARHGRRTGRGRSHGSRRR